MLMASVLTSHQGWESNEDVRWVQAGGVICEEKGKAVGSEVLLDLGTEDNSNATGHGRLLNEKLQKTRDSIVGLCGWVLG